MGLERYVAQLYAEGDLTLREVASLLELPVRETVERLDRLGAAGDITAVQNLNALEESRVLRGGKE